MEADTQHLHTKTNVGEKCNLRKIAANYVLESLHLVLLANCFEDVPLWVNCVIKPFVNRCNCFNNWRTEATWLSAVAFIPPCSSLSAPLTDGPLCPSAVSIKRFVSTRILLIAFVAHRDAKCGKIQCQGGANRPVIGTNAVSIETNIPLQEGGRILCRGTHVYLGDDMPDPGLVLAGTKCGDGLVSVQCRFRWHSWGFLAVIKFTFGYKL